MEIRPYKDSDKANVTLLWREVFPDAPSWNHPETNIEQKIAVQRELFLVAILGEKLVGTTMGGYDGHRGWIYYVAVHPDHRRQGIGSALMNRVEKDLTQIGCPKINLQVRSSNHQLVLFYKRLDYDVEERISMSKHLK